MKLTTQTIKASTDKDKSKKFILTPQNQSTAQEWTFTTQGNPNQALSGIEIDFSNAEDKSVTVNIELIDSSWKFLPLSDFSSPDGDWDCGDDLCTRTFQSETITISTPTSMKNDVTTEDSPGIKVVNNQNNTPLTTLKSNGRISLTFTHNDGVDDEMLDFKFVAYKDDGNSTYTGFVSADPTFRVRCTVGARSQDAEAVS